MPGQRNQSPVPSPVPYQGKTGGNFFYVNPFVRLATFTLYDGSEYVAPNTEFSTYNLVYDREFEASKTVTFILPIEFQMSQINGKVYELTGFDGETLTFSEPTGEWIHPNKPYLLVCSEGGNLLKGNNIYTTFYHIQDDHMKTTVGNATMEGSYTKQTGIFSDSEITIYGLSGGNFVRQKSESEGATQGATLNPFRTLIKVSGGAASSPRLIVALEEETSGVISIDDDALNQRPVNVYTLDGKLVRSAADPITCLQGLPEGMYIVDGQRIMKRGEAKQPVRTSDDKMTTRAAAGNNSLDGIEME